MFIALTNYLIRNDAEWNAIRIRNNKRIDYAYRIRFGFSSLNVICMRRRENAGDLDIAKEFRKEKRQSIRIAEHLIAIALWGCIDVD